MRPEAPSPKSEQVRQRLQAMIAAGELPAGERLPSERQLADRLGVNHRTLRRALDELVGEGVILKRPRIGNFVRPAAAPVSGRTVLLVAPHFIGGVGPQETFPQRLQAYSMLSMVMAGVGEVLAPPGYLLAPLLYTPGQFWEMCGELIGQRQVAGVVLWPDLQFPREALRRLLAAGTSVVLMARMPEFSDLNASQVFEGIGSHLQTSLDYLRDQGHRRITVLWYEASHRRAQAEEVWHRWAADAAWADCRQVDLPNHAGRRVLLAEVDGVIEQVLSAADRPTALVVPDATTARQVVLACERRGWSLPADLSLVVLGMRPELPAPVPRLAAPDMLRLNYDLGRTAGSLLREQVQEAWVARKEIALAVEMDWAASVARPPSGVRSVSL